MLQVIPEGGLLAAGEIANITVRFSPQEVEECSRRIVATIPNLASGLQAPIRNLSASVLRPWCHFDLPPSDYISAGATVVDTLLVGLDVLHCTSPTTSYMTGGYAAART